MARRKNRTQSKLAALTVRVVNGRPVSSQSQPIPFPPLAWKNDGSRWSVVALPQREQNV